MIVGILKEIKTAENRVSMTPAGVRTMVSDGHTLLVEKNGGAGAGFSDNDYHDNGAELIDTAEEIYRRADMVMHVKEPQPSEYGMMRESQIIFTYLHLAANEELTKQLIQSKAVCFGYETVEEDNGFLPLLAPMSEVAGRLAVLEGAKYLQKQFGGSGVLLSGVTGVAPGTILILGGGTVGMNAAKIGCGLGARVYLLTRSQEKLHHLSEIMPANCFIIKSSRAKIAELLPTADLVIGAVLIPGAQAPKLITKEMLVDMKKGSVLVDVSIDQGGCFETSHPTSHADPIYLVNDIVHYCVTNMPGAVAKTSTMALTNATLAYAREIADKGWKQCCRENRALAKGLNISEGKVYCKGVAEAFNLDLIENRPTPT